MYSMPVSILRALDALDTASDEESFVAAGKMLAEELGYEWFCYIFVNDGDAHLIGSYPKVFKTRYNERGYHVIDPILQCARRRIEPFTWDASNRLARGEAYVKEASSYGIQIGITAPLWGGFGKFSTITLAGMRQPAHSEKEYARNIHLIQVIGAYYHARFAILRDRPALTFASPLTVREKECLTWAAKGKSGSDIAAILHVTERTVSFHTVNARKKLTSISTTQAVAKAVGLGLINP